MTPRELLNDAIIQVERYKYPQINEFRAQFNELLKLADIGSINNDKIESLEEYDGIIYVTTSYSCRQCDMSSDYELPSFIIDDINPQRAAQTWGLEQKRNDTLSELAKIQKQLIYLESKLSNLEKQLGEVK